MKINTIIGARPQFIKAGIVSRAFQKYSTGVQETIIHTGQHYDRGMSEVFFEELEIPQPKYNLNIGGGNHGKSTGKMLGAIEDILLKEKPDWVLVYGDTNSTLAGALAAAKLHIPIAHIEAGLRSFNNRMPEEVNRVLTDHVSTLLFTPTDTATHNLTREGVKTDKIKQVGDIMYDAALFYKHKALRPSNLLVEDKFILCTIHRAENTDNADRLYNIISSLNKVAQHTQVILPLHPRTLLALKKGDYKTENLTIIEPVSYLQMIWLLNNCQLVVTDSGGLQKEAFFFKKPCIVTRDETEWVELTEIGVNSLAGADHVNIIDLLKIYLDKKNLKYDSFPYGHGNASLLIANLSRDHK